LPTDLDCLLLIRKGLIRQVMWAWPIGYKEWDICKLKRCLRDFKTKDHLCLVLDLLSFEFISEMV
jgi:hypothetical protein